MKIKLLSQRFIVTALFAVILLPNFVLAQSAKPAVYTAPKEDIERIRAEGMQRSQVMQTLSYMTDVIGPRLTGSPGMKRANEWTRDKMKDWGMQNAHLESWGPFGRGWSLKGFTAQVTSPQLIPVTAYPKAWSPSTKGAVAAEVVYFEAKTDADFEKYKGKLKGKIVLVSHLRPLNGIDKPLLSRLSDEDLTKLTEAPAPDPSKNSNAFSPEQSKGVLNYFN